MRGAGRGAVLPSFPSGGDPEGQPGTSRPLRREPFGGSRQLARSEVPPGPDPGGVVFRRLQSGLPPVHRREEVQTGLRRCAGPAQAPQLQRAALPAPGQLRRGLSFRAQSLFPLGHGPGGTDFGAFRPAGPHGPGVPPQRHRVLRLAQSLPGGAGDPFVQKGLSADARPAELRPQKSAPCDGNFRGRRTKTHSEPGGTRGAVVCDRDRDGAGAQLRA